MEINIKLVILPLLVLYKNIGDQIKKSVKVF